MTTRQERRARQRAVRKRQRSLVQQGLPPESDKDGIMAFAGLIRSALVETNNPQRALDAAELVYGVYETSARRHPPQKKIDCERGCTYCCHNLVTISAPEAFLITAWLDGTRRPIEAAPIDIEMWCKKAALAIGHSSIDRLGEKVPCAFLEDGLCRIYTQRPLACRSCLSYSVDACRETFEGNEVEVNTPTEPIMLRSNINFAMFAALRSLNYPAEGYELSEAVTRLLNTQDALTRWYAGEDVLAGVQTTNSWSPSVEKALAEIAAGIAP